MAIQFSKDQVVERMRFENPWWDSKQIDSYYAQMKHREYFQLMYPLVKRDDIRRALLLMGPRRVGKTVMIYQAIQKLIDEGVDPRTICYFSIETPLYNGISLEELLNLFLEHNEKSKEDKLYIFYDEIQYLKDWEVHLKSLVDSYHYFQFAVSGSAAAALKLKSNESGAGRFTEFELPPLTFHEFLSLTGFGYLVTYDGENEQLPCRTPDIQQLNKLFWEYINYGGYPELSLSAAMQSNPGRYIRNDIIDKVLMRDLPSLYGIHDIQELNSLFTYLAYHTGSELSLDGISQNSGVAKNTIKRYITYLEAAFLIKVVHRVDQNSKRFKRANFFKIYLTNPSLRSALFSPIKDSDERAGSLVETAIFAQWQHTDHSGIYYARWNRGEVDMVSIDPAQRPVWCLEIKWSNRFLEHPEELKTLAQFCQKHQLKNSVVTTIDQFGEIEFEGIHYQFVPASLYCYTVGFNLITNRLEYPRF
ncbi:ATP-binding protein [Pontibacter sp. G13]|uniref:ATP-binding protein n=1 Tax=Pontibacter sp. G13 TaxID=3074898 RepID=UPI00288BF030|nr:ATP-binding protein [Pontibacter sp. G13]WNJ16715.1 ATP-binding protein [Pontibacter sp. G13]